MDPELKRQQDALREMHAKTLDAKMQAPRKSAERYMPPHEQAIVDGILKAEEKPLWTHPDNARDYNPCAEIPLSFDATHIHLKTGGLYRLLFIGKLEKTLERVAIYQDRAGVVWVRPTSEFFDGRFQEVNHV